MSKRYNRREYLKLLGLTGAGVALASCAPAVAPTVAPAAPTAAQAGATEAPAAPALPTKFKKTKLTVPSWWGPHEIAGAEASFAGTFKKNTGIDVKYDFIGSD